MTKDEFISKYHKQKVKVFKFEPPTWEEFLATRREDTFAGWNNGYINIFMLEEFFNMSILNLFVVKSKEDTKFIPYVNTDNTDNREEMYYKALDIAQKWFLGED